MSAADCPDSMSKSIPMRWSDAYRSMNEAIPAADEQWKAPAAPPVEMTSSTPAASSAGMLASAKA